MFKIISLVVISSIALAGCDSIGANHFDPNPTIDILKKSGLTEIEVSYHFGSSSCEHFSIGNFRAKIPNGSYIGGVVCNDGQLVLEPLTKF